MYFLGGFAIHGYPSVPAYPGLARLRPRPDVDRAVALRAARLRHDRGRAPLMMSSPAADDPLIQQLREQLSDNDVRIVEALNARLSSSRGSSG